MGWAPTRRLLLAGWALLGFALWNALFEMMVVRGVKDYLLAAELSAAGRGPRIPISDVMDPAIRHGAWVATIWTALVWVAAGLTVHYASSHPRLESGVGAGTTRGDAER